MPDLDVKICGLSTLETLDAAIAAGASHVGFVHFAASPRHVELDRLTALVAHARGRATTVVVAVDPDDALVEHVARVVRPDAIQLHGAETPDRVAAVRAPEDLDPIAAYAGSADRLLLDAKRPAGSDLPGGNGVAFDWRLLERVPAGTEFHLAGGVYAGNLTEALAARPNGLDVSSGVESAPGVKDPARIAAFFAALAGTRPAPPPAAHASEAALP